MGLRLGSDTLREKFVEINTNSIVGVGGTPGGDDMDVQFNDNGSFGGNNGFQYNKTSFHAAIDGDGASTIDGTAYYALLPEDSSSIYTHASHEATFEARDTIGNVSSDTTHAGLRGVIDWTQTTANVLLVYVTGTYGAVKSSGSTASIDELVNFVSGVYGYAEHAVTANRSDLVAGVSGSAVASGTAGTLDTLIGGVFVAGVNSGTFAGTVVQMIGVKAVLADASSGVTTAIGLLIDHENFDATTTYGLYIDYDTLLNTHWDFAIYQASTTSISLIQGPLRIGGADTSSTAAAGFEVDEANATSVTTEKIAFLSDNRSLTLSSGTTLASHRHNQFIAPTINGVAGGATETVTTAATVYIDAAPSGSNITFTNGPYALWVDAGLSRFDGGIAIDGATTLNVTSGTYTPTRSSETNLDANVTMTEAQYLRVGNTVTVSGRFTADPTLTATATDFEITLPIASNIGAAEDAAGVAFCGSIAAQGAEIIGVAANDTAQIQWIAGDVTSQTWSYTFTYQVI